MTDEEFVRGWLKRSIGNDFERGYPKDAERVRQLVNQDLLPTCDPCEGVAGCVCNSRSVPSDVRFYLSPDYFIAICVKCDSWEIRETSDKKRRDRKPLG